MKNTDTRVQYTKMVLRDSLLKLLQNKSISKVTVKEICDVAGLNRGTFYLHYSTPEELLNEIQHEFLRENREIFENYWSHERDVNIMTGTFSCIFKNREICKIIMGPNGNPYFLENIKNMIHDGIVDEWLKEFPSYNRADLDFLFEYVFTGCMHLILNWIDDDQGISIVEFTQRLERLGHYSLLAVKEFNNTSSR